MGSSPITLAMELSQRNGGIAMCNRSGARASRSVESGRRDSDEVMPSIDSLTTELDLAPLDIEAVVISTGPGGFTGLRTSVAIAKMVSFTTGARVIPIDSAIVAVHGSDMGDGSFLVISGVKQDTFWLSRVEQRSGEWICQAGLSSRVDLDRHLAGVTAVFADDYLHEDIHATIEDQHIPVHPSTWNVESLLDVGLQFDALGKHVDPRLLQPLYPREPEAVRKWKEMHKGNR